MRTREILANAKRLGKEAGENAASWAFDGNTKDETYARVLRGINDADPEILDSLNLPNLSGEFAGDPTPQSIAEDCGLDSVDSRAEWLIDEICTEWENAMNAAFFTTIENTARNHAA